MLLTCLVVALGASAVVGWALNLPILDSVFHGSLAMKANTAIGIMLAGLGLAPLSRKKADTSLHFCTGALAVAIAALGALALPVDLIVSIAIILAAAGVSWNYTYQLKDATAAPTRSSRLVCPGDTTPDERWAAHTHGSVGHGTRRNGCRNHEGS